MEWIDYAAKGIGVLVALVTLLKVGSELYAKYKNGSEFGLRFGRRRKVKGLKYVSIFQKRGVLSSRNEISKLVKQRLACEIAKDVVHAYSIERRSHRFSRDTRDFVSLMLSMIILSVLVTAFVALSEVPDISPAKQSFVSFTSFMLVLCICASSGYVALQFYFVIMRTFDEGSSAAAAQNAQLVRVPLESIPYCIEKENDYIFVDATIRERHQVPFMGKADGVQMLLDYGAVIEEEVALKKSEAKQVKSSDYEDVAAELVDSFLSETLEDGNQPVYFVFSQAGITAVLVTQLLQRKGLRAFFIGATNGYESEVRETIREIRILRESGLL